MSAQPDVYPALYPGGLVEVALDGLQGAFAAGVPTALRRHLTDQLRSFIHHLQELGVRGDVWIDGSFATQKPEPQDIDVALAIGWPALTAMTDANKQRLAYLMNEEGRAYAQAKWNVDFYVFRATNFNERRYWFELFSKNPDSSNRKGIPFVRLT